MEFREILIKSVDRDHQITHLGGIKQLQICDNFEGFSLNGALFGLVI